jgi:hypothetical protein
MLSAVVSILDPCASQEQKHNAKHSFFETSALAVQNARAGLAALAALCSY